jgi:hypothetical protein
VAPDASSLDLTGPAADSLCPRKASKPFVGSSLRQLLAERAPDRYGDENLAFAADTEYYQLKVLRNG